MYTSYMIDSPMQVQVMVYSDYAKLRMLSMQKRGYKVSKIVEYLILEDQVTISRKGLDRYIKYAIITIR